MDAQQTQLAPRRKTFWKMVKTIFLPAQSVVRLMTGCGGGKSKKIKRRLTLRNMQEARDAYFLQSTIQRPPASTAETNDISHETQFQSTPSTIPSPYYNDEGAFPYEEISALPPFPNHVSPPISTETNTRALSSTSELPAPLNLEEAQLLLESLALSSACTEERRERTEVDQNWGEQIVNVDIEPHLSEAVTSSFGNLSSRASSQWDEDETDNVRGNLNDDVFEDNSARRELSSISTPRLDSISNNGHVNNQNYGEVSSNSMMRRSQTTATLSHSARIDKEEFHGWRRSSVEVCSKPPVTLAFIPSGLCIGDRIVWIKDSENSTEIPEIGTVRWIGKIRNQFYSGIEFDKPVGNSSGIYGYGVGMYKRFFTCQLPYGRFVPVKELVLYKDYHDTGTKSGIVCVICRDDFLDTWEPDNCLQTLSNNNDDDIQAPNMVSTKCGHLYHWGCLDHWFSTKKKLEYHCPFCLRPMARDEVIRIFPSQL